MISNIPKIELHVHLDGSFDTFLASNLLNEDISKVKCKMIANDKCKDLTEYLKMFDLPVSLMQTRDNLIKVSGELVNELEKDNVIYAEIRFAPLKHQVNGLSLDDIILSVLEGLNKNKNVKTNLILCMMRNDSFDDNLKVINIAEKYLNKGVCAIDLAGDEINYPTKNFKELFEIAKSKNIPFTIHAGEAGDVTSLKSALEFGAKRIGHGIKCVLDDEIYEFLKNNSIMLEVCPTSNYQTNAIDKYSDHPIYKIFKDNINLSINTDNRTVSNVTLNQEYQKLMDNFNFNLDDFIKINLNAINFSFLTDEEKKDLRDKYNNIINGGV
jgi:adenosine deaminase